MVSSTRPSRAAQLHVGGRHGDADRGAGRGADRHGEGRGAEQPTLGHGDAQPDRRAGGGVGDVDQHLVQQLLGGLVERLDADVELGRALDRLDGDRAGGVADLDDRRDVDRGSGGLRTDMATSWRGAVSSGRSRRGGAARAPEAAGPEGAQTGGDGAHQPGVERRAAAAAAACSARALSASGRRRLIRATAPSGRRPARDASSGGGGRRAATTTISGSPPRTRTSPCRRPRPR